MGLSDIVHSGYVVRHFAHSIHYLVEHYIIIHPYLFSSHTVHAELVSTLYSDHKNTGESRDVIRLVELIGTTGGGVLSGILIV